MPRRNSITERARDLLEFIEEYSEEKGFAPSYREMRDALGYGSISTVKTDLEILEEERVIKIEAGKARTVRVL